MRFIYSCLFYLATPLLLLKLWRRGKLAPAYRERIAERFGFPSRTSSTSPLWVHAVSVGEVVAIAPVLKQLIAANSQISILITTSTPTGANTVAKMFNRFDNVWHQYCPYDQPLAVASFIKKQKPSGLLIVETELWPNMLAQCAKAKIPVILANARMSEKSARGYAKLKALTSTMLQSLDLLVAQYASDGERFKQLGLPDEKLLVSGSIKFDLEQDPELPNKAAELKAQIGERPVLVLGSSHETEEQGVLALMGTLWLSQPDLLLVIVPRHPERFDGVAKLAENYSQHVLRRSKGAPNSQCQIYIGDTMGELATFYTVADVAIVGGSFVSLGGQNPIEPASVATPVLMGPEQFNFSVICPALEAAQGLQTAADFSVLQEQLLQLFCDPERMAQMGANAKAYVESQRGATKVLVANIQQRLIDRD